METDSAVRIPLAPSAEYVPPRPVRRVRAMALVRGASEPDSG
jgi:hypothetical protein